MSLVFPNALAARTANLALAKGAFWFGMVCLASAFSSLGLILLDRSSPVGLPALAALLVIAGAGALLASPAGARVIVIALVVVATLAAITVYAAVLLPNLRALDSSDSILLSLPKMAIVVFGVIVAPHHSGIAGVVVAAAVAETPVVLLSLAGGHGFSPDVPALACMVALVLTLALLEASRERARASEPVLTRASRDDVAESDAARAEHISSALVHDTILNELAVIGTVAPGELSVAARDHVRRSMARLRATGEHGLPDADVLGGDVAAAVEQAREMGLEVRVAGEVTAVDSLDPLTSEALGLAVLQCLTNVSAHAGVAVAELTVLATELEVCVMVIDAGAGFIESQVEHDRLGVRWSVRGRIADVGGTVQVWTAPGEGTAVSMRVPRS
jgi:signal transduction histidine kinase